MSLPSRRMRPDSGCSKPARQRRRVVLPQPDGPSRKNNSPLAISKETFCNAGTTPNDLLTCSNAIFICLSVCLLHPPSGGWVRRLNRAALTESCCRFSRGPAALPETIACGVPKANRSRREAAMRSRGRPAARLERHEATRASRKPFFPLLLRYAIPAPPFPVSDSPFGVPGRARRAQMQHPSSRPSA